MASSGEQYKRARIRFPNIDPKAWEHPTDRAALSALQSVPGLDKLLQAVLGLVSDKSLRLISLASSVRVTNRQFAEVQVLYSEACEILDVKERPELYVSQNPVLNAGAIGFDRPFIVLNSALLDTLSDEELLAILGHELAHCLSGHLLYKTVLTVLRDISFLTLRIPLAAAALLVVEAALNEWSRKSELSADRAALLVTQDPEVIYSMFMKLTGGSQIAKMDMNEFFLQAAEYEDGGDMLDGVYKFMNLLRQSHPFPVLRLTQLKSWVDSGGYKEILAGGYTQRVYNEQESVYSNVKKAAKNYRDDLKTSNDAFTGTVSSIVDGAEEAISKTVEIIESTFKSGKNKE